MDRRSILIGLGATLATPAIVKAENIMKIASLKHNVIEEDIVYNVIKRYTVYNGDYFPNKPRFLKFYAPKGHSYPFKTGELQKINGEWVLIPNFERSVLKRLEQANHL